VRGIVTRAIRSRWEPAEAQIDRLLPVEAMDYDDFSKSGAWIAVGQWCQQATGGFTLLLFAMRHALDQCGARFDQLTLEGYRSG
jgi:hypothetical protein